LLCTLGLVAVLIAVLAGRQIYDNGLDQARYEAASRSPIRAILLKDPVVASVTADGAPAAAVRALASWRGPDGVDRSGLVDAPEDARAGTVVDAWADRDGSVVPRPRLASDAVASAVLLAGLLFVTMLVLLCLAWTGARAAIATRNLVAWEREWAAVEPEWRRKA
jgi:hypothetical protein